MRRCPACKRSISAESRKCPLCGYPIPTPILGRYLAAQAVRLIVMAMIALWIPWYVRKDDAAPTIVGVVGGTEFNANALL